MPSYFDLNQGAFYRQPSWHRLEQEIYTEWPGSWEELRGKANLLWEPETEPVYALRGIPTQFTPAGPYEVIPGYQAIKRNDTKDVLAIQSDKYRVISNSDFGLVIETLLGGEWGQTRQYEGLFTLFGGRLVICVVRDEAEEHVVGDPSATLTYTVFVTRHDGQGGLKVVRTKIRVVCWNTWSAAEHAGVDNKTSFTVRHTANWNERVAEVRDRLAVAQEEDTWYVQVMDELSKVKATPRTRDKFLTRLLPIGDDMGERQQTNRMNEREQIRTILEGPTCEAISGTVYGLVQASGEWSDHYRRYRSPETYVNRTLFTAEPTKVRAFRLGKQMAGIK